MTKSTLFERLEEAFNENRKNVHTGGPLTDALHDWHLTEEEHKTVMRYCVGALEVGLGLAVMANKGPWFLMESGLAIGLIMGVALAEHKRRALP